MTSNRLDSSPTTRRILLRSLSCSFIAMTSLRASVAQNIKNHSEVGLQNQLTTENQQIKPYLQVPFIASEESTVRVFFSPNCPYSANNFDFFSNLSKTLPKELRFELSVLPNTKDSAVYALSYLAIRRYYPRNLKLFVQASFKACQEMGLSSKSWSVIQRLGTVSHIPVNVPALVLNNKSVLTQDLTDLINLCKALKVTNTPCVAVDGTYTVTPEFVNGADPAIFNQLVNSIISMAIGA